MSYAFAAPIPPGKTAAVRAFIAETLGPRKAELDDLSGAPGSPRSRTGCKWILKGPTP